MQLLPGPGPIAVAATQTVFTRSEKTSANNLYCYVLIKMCSTLKYLSAVGSCPASELDWGIAGSTIYYDYKEHSRGI